MSLLLLFRRAITPIITLLTAATTGYQVRATGRSWKAEGQDRTYRAQATARQWRIESTLNRRYSAVAAGRNWRACA
ncbi:hypothetical protein [Rhodoferax sp.]|uniref:hypothetical protein n=1 Tax=Rhodoferax sp. TaxID=50421 RepID=UPI002ACD3DA3|nr:hypothetical protein [Rhodoferax sp.]MDZ7920742.1 hypothetical protein [Rhodoferax sp.]